MNALFCHATNAPPLKYHQAVLNPRNQRTLYIFGGISKTRLNSQLYSYDVIQREFHVLDGTEFTSQLSRVGMSMIFRSVDAVDSLVIYGGVNIKRHHQNERLLVYDFAEKRWRMEEFDGDEAERPGCISNHTALYHEERDEMVVFGGNDPVKKTWINEVYILDLRTRAWRRARSSVEQRNNSELPANKSTTLIPKGRCGHTANFITYKGKRHMIIFGGTTQIHRLNDTWLFSLQDETWERIDAKGSIPPPLNNHASVTHQSMLYIFGGFPENKSLYQLDLDTNTWSTIHVASPTIESVTRSRFGHTLNLIPNRASPNAEHPSMLLFGGADEHKDTLCDVYEFHTAEEHKYNVAVQEVQETLHELRFKFNPHLLTNQLQKFLLHQQLSTEADIVHAIVSKLAHFRLRPSIQDSSNTYKPVLIKKLAETVSGFKQLNQTAKFHNPQQKQLTSSLQTLIAEYVAQHTKLKHQSIIESTHELLTFYNRLQCKLSELFLRYLLVILDKDGNKRIPTSVRISTHMISSEAISLGRELFHLLVAASKPVHNMISALISPDMKAYFSSSGMVDLSCRLSAIEVLSECVARSLTMRYAEQIKYLSTSLCKPATIYVPEGDDNIPSRRSSPAVSEDNSVVPRTDSEEDHNSETHIVRSRSEIVQSTTTDININPPGGCEILADCAVKHILFFVESAALQERQDFPDNPQELTDQLVEVVFRGGVLTDFNQDLEPTPVETDPKLSIQSQWTDVGVFRMSGIRVDAQCFASLTQTKYCGAPHIYRFRLGTLEEADRLGLTKIDPNASSLIDTAPELVEKKSGSSEVDRMRDLVHELKLENAQLRRELDRLSGMKRQLEQFTEKVNADKQVESAFREEEKRRFMQLRMDVSKKERQMLQVIEEREIEAKSLHGKIQHLEQYISALKDNMQTTDRYNRELVERLHDLRQLEDDNRLQKQEIESLLQYKAKMQGKPLLLPLRVRTLKDSVQNLKAAIHESKKVDYDVLAKQLKDVKQELAQKHLEIVEQTRLFQEHRNRAQKEKVELEEKLARSTQQIGLTKQETESIEERLKLELASVRERLGMKIDNLERELDEKQGLLNRFTTERAKMATAEQSLRDELNDLRQRLSGNEELIKFRQQMDAQEVERLRHVEHVSKLEREIARYKEEIAANAHQEHAVHRDVESLQQENQMLLNRVEKLKTVQKENKNLRTKLAQAQNDGIEATTRLHAENDELQAEVKKLNEHVIMLQNRLAKAVNGE